MKLNLKRVLLGLGISTSKRKSEGGTPAPPPAGFSLLLENGDNILLENSDNILLEG